MMMTTKNCGAICGQPCEPDDEPPTEILSCERCGGDHPEIVFVELECHADTWDHWALCPETGEPLTLRLL